MFPLTCGNLHAKGKLSRHTGKRARTYIHVEDLHIKASAA